MILEFINFLKKPHTNLKKEKGVVKNFLVLIMCFFLSFSGVIFFSILLSILNFMGVDENIFKHSDSFIKIISKNDFNSFLTTVVITPIIEELGFRLYLRKKDLFLIISLSFLYYFLAKFFLLQILDIDINIWYIRFSVLVVFGLISLFKKKLSNFYLIKYTYIFYLSCFLFAFFHLSNFLPLSKAQILFFPILIFPQFIYGILFGYIRLKSGIIWSCFLHSSVNFVGFLIIFISTNYLHQF